MIDCGDVLKRSLIFTSSLQGLYGVALKCSQDFSEFAKEDATCFNALWPVRSNGDTFCKSATFERYVCGKKHSMSDPPLGCVFSTEFLKQSFAVQNGNVSTHSVLQNFKTHFIKLALLCQGVFKRGASGERFGHWVDEIGEFESLGYEALFMHEVS